MPKFVFATSLFCTPNHSLSIYYSYPTSAAYEMEGEREGDFLFPLFPECQNKRP